MKILNKLGDISSDNSILSNSSSYNEIDDVEFADIIINDDSDIVEDYSKAWLVSLTWWTCVNFE